MTATITRAHVEQFKQNCYVRAQQRGSRLLNTVSVEYVTGAIHNFERIGATQDVEKVDQYADTPNQAIEHDRRQVVLRDWHWAKMIDRTDDYKTLIDIEGKYTQAGQFAMGRRWDTQILAAMLGNATSKVPGASKGEYTLTNVAFDTGNVVAAGGNALTLDKVIDAKDLLLQSDVDEDNDEMFIAVNSYQLHQMLRETKVQSADYNSIKALVQGQINTFMGLTWIRTEMVANDGTNDQCPVWCKSGIGLAIGKDLEARSSVRDDKSYSPQVYLSHSCEATRIEEEKVVRIDCVDRP